MTPFPGGKPKDEHDTKLLYIDQQVDRLLTGIGEVFGDQPRMVIVSADHGESFDESHSKKARARHAWDLSTSVTRVPLIVWSPYGTPRRTARIANGVDIVPTVLNALGLTTRGLDGDSLLPTLLHGTDPGRPILQQMFFPEYVARGKPPLGAATVRGGDLVLHRDGSTNTLFDYVRDPGEERDLFAARRDTAGDLAEIMQEMLDEGAQVDNARR
jgi:arylsulfatase A-like enzyme